MLFRVICIFIQITNILWIIHSYCIIGNWRDSGSKLSINSGKNWKEDIDYWKGPSTFPDISSAEWTKLIEICERINEWNTKVNLVSRKDVDHLVPNHLLVSISILLIRQFSAGESIIDVGTGGGFPGLPLAILCPDAKFTLLDSNMKKMAVVNDIVKSMKLPNVEVVRARAEDVRESYDFILGRAVAAIPKFLSFSSHFLSGRSKVAKSSSITGTEIGK